MHIHIFFLNNSKSVFFQDTFIESWYIKHSPSIVKNCTTILIYEIIFMLLYCSIYWSFILLFDTFISQIFPYYFFSQRVKYNWRRPYTGKVFPWEAVSNYLFYNLIWLKRQVLRRNIFYENQNNFNFKNQFHKDNV